MKKMVFIGISLSGDFSSFIDSWFKKNRHIPPFDSRFIELVNLHLTLIPPWYEENLGSLFMELENKVNKDSFKPFELVFNKIITMPNKSNPRLVWFEGVSSLKIFSLRNSLKNILKIDDLDHRTFVLHVTLLRFKNNSANYFERKIKFIEKVDSFSLFESKLSSRGATYTMLRKFTFRN